MDSLTFASSQKEESDSAEDDAGKTKAEIQDNFNSYPVMIERKTLQPVRREAR